MIVVAGLLRPAINRGWNGIGCDAPGCDATINLDRTYNPSRARAEAAASGWTCVGDQDFCPAHSERTTA